MTKILGFIKIYNVGTIKMIDFSIIRFGYEVHNRSEVKGATFMIGILSFELMLALSKGSKNAKKNKKTKSPGAFA